MKLMIASDIHGSAFYCRKMVQAFEREQAQRLLLLGDLLYHGPRNDLPEQYDPKAVIEMLNALKEEILCVRGNCDSEVDQMVLDFPMLADYMLLYADDIAVFATHGHIYNTETRPPLHKGDILLHGHTHVQAAERHGEFVYLNPGSVSIPKAGNENSYMIFENGLFTTKNLDGKEISVYSAQRK